jgi:hypothetical protein
LICFSGFSDEGMVRVAGLCVAGGVLGTRDTRRILHESHGRQTDSERAMRWLPGLEAEIYVQEHPDAFQLRTTGDRG